MAWPPSIQRCFSPSPRSSSSAWLRSRRRPKTSWHCAERGRSGRESISGSAVPLDRYRKKRDLRTSPEPAGHGRVRAARAARRRELFFCVQKHLASHLHYDLRLEHGGVLLSWAVPKGPSLDPRDKRLAMQTEDHPYEYGMFEGVIPSGYGAGIVMLWDRGSWRPEVEDVGAALAKGGLKFTLDGNNPKGPWALGGRGGAGGPRGSW